MKILCSSRLHLQILVILACFAINNAVRSDIDCLKSFKDSVGDPENLLSSWDFNNETEGFICLFAGVDCWHIDESRVLNIRLSGMGLRGTFPRGIQDCTSLTGLDLSSNLFTGPIPSNLGDVLPFVSPLDLSNNYLSGPIPPSIANLRFLNVLKLDNNHLTGQIPQDLSELSRLKEFSVANNRLSGPIPSNLGDVLPYVLSLDLSNNYLSGPIPPSIANLSFLNVLRLDNNQLTGQIPLQLEGLYRIKEFSVANNRLSGQVPVFPNSSMITRENYANNLGLCGGPLSPCKSEHHEDRFIFGFAVGFPLSTILTMSVMFSYLPKLSVSNTRLYLFMIRKINVSKHHSMITESPQILLTEDNSNEESKVTAMEKYISRLSLVELKMATNDFDNKKVIGYGSMGIMYKAGFPNGLLLAVKRIHKFENFETDFLLEIEILGRLRHINLVPILGFCFEMEKKFLVYKYMSNGTLHQWLYSKPQVEGKKMGWTLRFKIAIGIARGLTWLHYNNVLRVAHLNISSKCILLDDTFEPKISNFGGSNILMNTSGIPSSGGNFVVPDSSPSYKEDVYRFGILLLELITGKEASMLECRVIDECLMGQGFDEEIYETLKIAETCIRAYGDGTTSMLQVYQAMRGVGISRNEISVNFSVNADDNEGDV